MLMDRHPHSEFIAALGGSALVARWMNKQYPKMHFSRHRVHRWKEIGIAWQWRRDLIKMAKSLKVEVPSGFLEHEDLKDG